MCHKSSLFNFSAGRPIEKPESNFDTAACSRSSHEFDGRGAAVAIAGHHDVDALVRRLALLSHHIVVAHTHNSLAGN